MVEQLQESTSKLKEKIEKINHLWEIYSFHTGNFDRIILKSKDFNAPLFTEKDWDISIISVNWNDFELAINIIYKRLINADEIIINYSWKDKIERHFDKIERVFKYDNEIQNFVQIKWTEEKTWIEVKLYDTIEKISKVINSIF